MSAWIQSHQTLNDHPKKDRLAELLFNGSVPDDVADLAAVGLLHRLWWWALDYAQDGDLSGFSDRQVARGCRWIGDAGTLIAALTQAGFMDTDRQIHDWRDYGGKLIKARKDDVQRVQSWRQNRRSETVTDNVPVAYDVEEKRIEEKKTKDSDKSLQAQKPVDNSRKSSGASDKDVLPLSVLIADTKKRLEAP